MVIISQAGKQIINQYHFELEKNDMIELDLDVFLLSVLLSLSLLLVFSNWLLLLCTILSLTCSCNMTCRSTSHSSSCCDRVTFCCTASINCEFTCMLSILALARSTSATFFLSTAASLLLQALLIKDSLLRLLSSTSFFSISLSSSAALSLASSIMSLLLILCISVSFCLASSSTCFRPIFPLSICSNVWCSSISMLCFSCKLLPHVWQP